MTAFEMLPYSKALGVLGLLAAVSLQPLRSTVWMPLRAVCLMGGGAAVIMAADELLFWALPAAASKVK